MRDKGNRFLIRLGLLLIAAALLLAAFNVSREYRSKKAAQQVADQLKAGMKISAEGHTTDADIARNPGETEIPDYLLNPDMDMPALDMEGEKYIGILQIPSLSLELPVLRDGEEEKLDTALGCCGGSCYTGSMVIVGRNYPCFFGRLNRLRTGDEIVFTDIDGNVFLYEVQSAEQPETTVIQKLSGDGWALTLGSYTAVGHGVIAIRCAAQKDHPDSKEAS